MRPRARSATFQSVTFFPPLYAFAHFPEMRPLGSVRWEMACVGQVLTMVCHICFGFGFVVDDILGRHHVHGYVVPRVKLSILPAYVHRIDIFAILREINISL